MKTVVLLIISNIFMTIAWYGHLKYKSSPLWMAVLVSWLIAFVEYCFQVPANRIGHYQFSAAQLKTIQEVSEDITYGTKANISYLAELIPTSVLKFSLKILVHLTSRDTVDNIYSLRKHPKNLYDIFGIRFGVNSPNKLTFVLLRKFGAH